MIKTKKQMYLVILSFVLVILLGTVTYAFFNYTRTGSANVIKTGRIAFNSTQGTSINLDNLFPIDPTETGIMNDATKVGTVTINVTGDTTYGDGIEYLVSAVNVTNTVGSGANAKALPISIDVSVTSNTGNDPATTLGTADSSYFTNRGSTASTSIYKVLAGDTISNNEELLVGYIKSGATGVDGNIVIKAYIDNNKIAISDTYPEQAVRTVKTTGYSSSACETVLTGVTNASTYCASASSLQTAIDNEDLTSAQINLLVNAGIVDEYTDGTTSSWVDGRTVFTTTEWNSLQTNGVSFQVKVEANEGIWVDEPPKPICIRATTLHTENCSYTSGSYYCYGDGYYNGGTMDTTTITYGNLGTSGNTPVVGDAFDCDVNGDGNYTERFYYVSSYYNTDTLTFDNTTGYATLIYYSNTVSGVASTNGSEYYSSNENWHGPVVAKANLPTTQEWSNITLKNTERAILAEKGGTHNATSVSGYTLPTAFSYEGYAARLLTAQELMNGCGLTQVGSFTAGELSTSCKFLMEGTKYADSSKATDGPWLETPDSSHYIPVLNVIASSRWITSTAAGTNYPGARPAIDVPYSKLEY